MHRRRTTLLTVIAASLVACGGAATLDGETAADVERGEELFQANCALCHGPQGQGTNNGPPLVHEVYEPGHHSDASFHRAVEQGVAAHHWDFGDMPPIGGLDTAQVDDIVAWVRERQREAGID
ncbi:cytochrome c [Egicoccus sp. AB-alg6-2]|uniref:c-type cytochrome n=1 Tax=Egicoccus sp. AB-alg6-2 TaxID=3242692 RepID=UPI00359CE941